MIKTKKNYTDLGKFMIRVPMLAYEIYKNFYYENKDKSLNNDSLLEICNNNIFKEAVLVSSKDLYDRINRFIKDKDESKMDKFKESISKYLIRMSTRTTPFGMYSGIAVGNIENKNNIIVNESENIKRSRVDIEWLYNIIKKLENDIEVNKKLTFIDNSSILFKGNRASIPYNTSKLKSNERINEISIRATNAFHIIYKLCKIKSRNYTDIVNSLIKMYPNTDKKRIEQFLNQLIEKEFLISNLRPPLTCNCELEYLINELEDKSINNDDILYKLREIKDLIDKYNTIKIGEGEKTYINIYNKMNLIQESKTPLQVDSKISFSKCSIDRKVVENVNDFIEMVLKLSLPLKGKDTPMESYKGEFMERYGENREVELLEVLDNDIGIGSPLSYLYPKNNRKIYNKPTKFISDKVSKYFWLKYYQAVHNNTYIEIKDDEINSLDLKEVNVDEMPLSLDLNFMLTSSSQKSFEQGEYELNLGPNIGASSAGRTFGRFTHILAEEKGLFKEIDDKERALLNDENTEFCEIVYLPNTIRSANVVRNCNNRKYEIAICTNSSKDEKHTISLDDLVLGIDNNGLFYVKSKMLNKKLIITNNNMLNNIGASNVCRFLKEVSQDGIREWSDLPWWVIYENMVYIPRIKYKNITVSLAKWKLDKINMNFVNIKKDNLTYDIFIHEFTNKKNIYDIPDYVYITDADNRVLLNLKNDKCLKLLYENFKHNFESEIIITEVEDNIENAIEGEHGRYIAEIVIPIIRCKPNSLKRVTNNLNNNVLSSIPSVRLKRPFQEWIFLKLYGIRSREEEFISFYIQELCQNFIDNKYIYKYFFMRYADPVPHIRLRLNGEMIKLLQVYPIIDKWIEKLFHDGIISDYNLSCYDREIERYGGVNLIDSAENVFFKDSLVVENILREKKLGNITLEIQKIAMISMIHYMNNFKYEYNDQLQWLNSIIESKEHRDEFKENRKEYMNLCNDYNNWENLRKRKDGDLILNILNIRNEAVREYRDRVEKETQLTNTNENILAGIIHLHCNRLLGVDRELERKLMALTRHTLYALKYIKTVDEKNKMNFKDIVKVQH
ncbi:lantibiotic dehydratase [Clostridium sp. JS66]|uniref:lantibiotic dehydratase n=1 Tax=Clostridium sp. JS66 TaxID=3064705 RepID=UPI00298DA846|nr:lantibiotic dehydratase [Clostridium sp. JS66]WPC43329.1 lantibiotic dehydratase [Clostridium sp. JS66]